MQAAERCPTRKAFQGPSKELRASGSYCVLFVRLALDGRQVRLTVGGDKDPSYGSTSKMIGKSAIEVPEVLGRAWTPGAALRQRLIDWLTANAGMTFAVES